jgi:tRNA G18 (ribose-2'-O)-methylase SpoU
VKPDRTRGPSRRTGPSLQGRTEPDGIETFYEVRTRDSALAPDEFARLPRRPVHVVLDNLRSAFNVGSIFRLADAVRAAEVITCGYTAHPPHHKLAQTALGATASVPTRHFTDTADALSGLRASGCSIVAVKTADRATPYHQFEPGLPLALVFGNEAMGVSRPALALCDSVVELPVFGYKNSVNVATAAAVVLYEVARRAGWLDSQPGPR